MAAGCRRLSLLLSRNLVPGARRVYHRVAATPTPPLLDGDVSRVPLLTRAPPTTCQQYCTKVVDTKVATSTEEEVVEEPPGIFKRLWRWLHSDDGELEYQMSEEERQERDDMLLRVQEMYFADPPIEPDLDTFKDVIRMLIKYNDRLGVEALWNVMPEMKITPDEELTFIVTTFLEETKWD